MVVETLEKSGNMTSDELLDLKKKLAEEVVNKLLEKNPDLLSSVLKKSVVANYLVADGSIDDFVIDKFMIKFWWETTWLLTISETLERYRGLFSEADTKNKLENLRETIFNEISWTGQVETSTQEELTTNWDSSESSSELDDSYSKSGNPWNSNESSVWLNVNNGLKSYEDVHLDKAVVEKAWNYIENWWTFKSSSKWIITWGKGEYKHVCSTWSYAVLNLLWIENKSGNNNCDLKWTVLPKMWLKYIGEVDPDNPGKDWYVPHDGDTAVWPQFYNGKKKTQHQATYIAWHWVSDTIQDKMSCYGSKNEPNVKIYRYTWESLA